MIKRIVPAEASLSTTVFRCFELGLFPMLSWLVQIATQFQFYVYKKIYSYLNKITKKFKYMQTKQGY